MQITLLDMLDLISVGTPVSWGDVQRTAGEAASAIRKLMDERDSALAAMQSAYAEASSQTARADHLQEQICERRYLACAVASLEAAE